MKAPKAKRKKESAASMEQRSMALDLFEQALEAYQGVEPVVSLSYDRYSVYIDVHDTLPALREEIAADKRKLAYLGNRSQPITTKEWEDKFNKLDLSDRSLLVDSAITRKLHNLPEPEKADRSFTLVVAVKEGELARKGLIPA